MTADRTNLSWMHALFSGLGWVVSPFLIRVNVFFFGELYTKVGKMYIRLNKYTESIYLEGLNSLENDSELIKHLRRCRLSKRNTSALEKQ